MSKQFIDKNNLKIVEVNNDNIILEIVDKSPLAIARYSYLSGDMKYISVSLGKKFHVNIIDKNSNSYPMISFYTTNSKYNFERLQNSIRELFLVNKIYQEITGDMKVSYGEQFLYGNDWHTKIIFDNKTEIVRFFDKNNQEESTELLKEFGLVLDKKIENYNVGFVNLFKLKS